MQKAWHCKILLLRITQVEFSNSFLCYKISIQMLVMVRKLILFEV